MQKKLLVVALGLSSAITFVGCGGGDGGDGGDNSGQAKAPTSVFYTVKVIDGYLKNAQVWLDIDGDKQLGSNEPSALSAEGGVAILDVTNVVTPQQYLTYAKIIFGQTIDESSGPVASDYIMSALPGDQAITPLSTLVSIEVAQNTDGSETAEKLALVKQAAVAKVADDLGIEKSDVLSDYIAGASGSTTYVAANIVNSKILPKDESEFIAVVADAADDATFNKKAVAASAMIKDVVEATAGDEFDSQAAVFDSNDDLDTDNDADGVPNALDALPDDVNEWLDSDGDLIGNNADPDDDNDGVEDSIDAYPLDPTKSEYADCVVKYTEVASIADFNAQLAVCNGLPGMDLAGNGIIRLTSSLEPRAYVFNIDNTAAFYQNGNKYNRIWKIDSDGNLALYNGDGQTLNYLMRLIDNSTADLKFAVFDNGKQKIWTTEYVNLDVSADVLACGNVPINSSSYSEFKQAVASCQDGKFVASFSADFMENDITLTTSDASSQADDVDTYQFNADGSGTFTHTGLETISVPMTWTIHEEGVIKVVLNYTDKTVHDYLAIVETNGIDFSVKVFSRSTDFEGLGDAAGGKLWSTVLKVPAN